MEKHVQQLELAKAHFYAWRMPEAYSIFRRFFDRLPFAFDPAHAEYIAVYVRLLAEMGKDREMAFYRGIVEGIYRRKPDPYVAYSLVVLYLFGEPSLPEAAKSLLDSCLEQSTSESLTVKAKLLLASYYSTYKEDYAACDAIVRSIQDPADPHLYRVVQIWRANLMRTAGNLSGAETVLQSITQNVAWKDDWYSVFSAQVILGILWIEQGRFEEARNVLLHLKEKTGSQKLKCVARQLASLEQKLDTASQLGSCVLQEKKGSLSFQYKAKHIRVKPGTSSGKLLLLFLKRKHVVKEDIIQAVYSRKYSGESDDALVYYQVHSLRKQLEKTGLPPEAIQTASGGYLWRPEVKTFTETESEELL